MQNSFGRKKSLFVTFVMNGDFPLKHTKITFRVGPQVAEYMVSAG